MFLKFILLALIIHFFILGINFPKQEIRANGKNITIIKIIKVATLKKSKAVSLNFSNIPMKSLNHYNVFKPSPKGTSLGNSSKGLKLMEHIKSNIRFPLKLSACNKEGSITSVLHFDKHGKFLEMSSIFKTKSPFVKVGLIRQLRKIRIPGLKGLRKINVQFIFRNNAYPEASTSFINHNTLIIEVLRHDLAHHTNFKGIGGSHCPSKFLDKIKQDRAFAP